MTRISDTRLTYWSETYGAASRYGYDNCSRPESPSGRILMPKRLIKICCELPASKTPECRSNATNNGQGTPSAPIGT